MRRTSVSLLLALAALMVSLITPPAVPALSPGEPYRYRGVIFGSYGKTWTHDDRMSVIGWMGRPWRDTGRPRMNIYIHAAKDDIYQRLRWRAPYPAAQMNDFIEEIALARSRGVEWVPNVSPGFPLIPSAATPDGPPSRDICFSCPADLEVLVAKLRPFAIAGVRTFMVSFDDVQKISSHPQDIVAYGLGAAAYGRMTADVLNRLQARLRAEFGTATVLTVPAEYSGTGPSPYLSAFGQTLDADIPVMWTGTEVLSNEILAWQAASYRDSISTPESGPRPLVIWDNYPANDVQGNIFSSTGLPTNFKLNMGPYKGRGADLADVIEGIVSNPMNEAEASKIPLYTIAAYLNDPTAFTDAATSCPLDETVGGCLSEAAWLEGIEEFGGGASDAVLDFVGQMRSTLLDREESTAFRTAWQALRDAYEGAFWTEPWSALVAELEDEAASPGILTSELGNERFLEETASHLKTLAHNVAAGLAASDLLAAMRPGLEATITSGSGGSITIAGRATPPDTAALLKALVALLPEEVLMRASPYSVHGDRFQHAINDVYIRENQMDAFTAFAHEALAGWLPGAVPALAGPVVVTVNGVAVPLDASGAFTVTIPSTAEVVVVATDGSGAQTGLRPAG